MKINNNATTIRKEEATGTQDEDQQQQQQPLEKEATKQLTKDEKKIKVSEICNDELDNDHDGIIDEEHDCLSRTPMAHQLVKK